MRYMREKRNSNSDTWQPDGIDRYYIRFADGHRWIDYWTSDIIPLKKQMTIGNKQSADLYPCSWVPYSMLNDHLHNQCCHRTVLIGGDASAVRTVTSTTGRMSDRVTTKFLGQQTTVAECVTMAHKRVEINEFLTAAPPRSCCDYCSNEVEDSLMEKHLAKECQHVFVRCKLGCGEKVMKKALAQHMETECPKRNVYCKECNMELWAEEVEDHANNHCEHRIVPCRYGCGAEGLKAGDLDRH